MGSISTVFSSVVLGSFPEQWLVIEPTVPLFHGRIQLLVAGQIFFNLLLKLNMLLATHVTTGSYLLSAYIFYVILSYHE